MRHLLVSALLLTGGVALADGVRVDVHAQGPRIEETHYRDHHRRPVVRVEKYETRRGYRWHPGEWRWESSEWQWHGGWYVRS